MPIIVIHGVNVRDPHWADDGGITDKLIRYVAPAIQKGATCTVNPVYWGDVGVDFKWNHRSLPGDETRQLLAESFMPSLNHEYALAAGPAAHEADAVVTLLSQPAQPPAEGFATYNLTVTRPQPVSPYGVGAVSEKTLHVRFQTALAAKATAQPTDAAYASTSDALRQSVHGLYDPAKTTQTFTYQDVEQRASLILMQHHVPTSWLGDLANAIVAAIERAHHGDATAMAKALVSYREPINDLVTTFFGDVFVYLATRGAKETPGPILQRFLSALRDAANEKAKTGEAIVVLSHSQGGQIVYEALSSIVGVQAGYTDIKVDFWCAAACQVGLFEEMKLFWSSSSQYSAKAGNKAPSPKSDVLGTWIACWDPTDVISYTAAPIFDGVLDVSFESGWAPPMSHGGYLALPEFYLRLHNTIVNPTAASWYAPVNTD